MRKYQRTNSRASSIWRLVNLLGLVALLLMAVWWWSRPLLPAAPKASSLQTGVASKPPADVSPVPPTKEATAAQKPAASKDGVARVQFTMHEGMEEAWLKSSNRLTFPIGLQINGDTGSVVNASATFYGKSSLKLKYTKRRSLQIDTPTPVYITPEAPAITSFLLLSLWEDKYRIAYLSATELLRDAGLFFSFTKLVELRCTGGPKNKAAGAGGVCPPGGGTRSFGAYLLVEYPSDAIRRALREELRIPAQHTCESKGSFAARRAILQQLLQHSTAIDISTRNWFYFEKPPIYDVLKVPGYTRDSPLSPLYKAVERNPLAHASLTAPFAALSAESPAQFDMERYMVWVALNAVLQNGDWDDEVFVYGIGQKFLSVMAWDYDSIFKPCHRVKHSARTQLMFCAETPIEHAILGTPALMTEYVKTLRCVLDEVATQEHWDNILDNAANELKAILDASPENTKATFDDAKEAPPDVATGVEALSKALTATRTSLEAAMPGERVALKREVHEQLVRHEPLCPASELQQEFDTYGRMLRREFKRQGYLLLDARAQMFVDSRLSIVAPNRTAAIIDALFDVPLYLNEPGLYCATGKVKKANCAGFLVRPFVVRSAERGSAEFGVPHYTKPDPMSLAVPSVPKGTRLTARVPKAWPPADASFPVLLGLAGSSGEWLKQNTVVQRADSSDIATSMIIRGRSVLRLARQPQGLQNAIDGPVLTAQQGSDAPPTLLQVTEADGGGALSVAVAAPTWPNASTFIKLESFDGRKDFTAQPCNVRIAASIIVEADARVVFGPGCILEMPARSSITIDGTLVLQGSAADPIVVTGATGADGTQWNTLLVRGKQGALEASHVFFAHSGLKGERVEGTGKHHTSSAAITAVQESTVTITDCVFVAMKGPAFAAGSNARVRVADSVVQWAELGAECLNCDFVSNGTVWSNFPRWDAGYADEDNDALYLSGGTHHVTNSVIAHTKDDGIDSGTRDDARNTGGSIAIEHSIVEMCQHEGIALSSGHHAARTATLRDCRIEHCQQGVESGYTSKGHVATATGLTVRHTLVGIRYGDNYFQRPQEGSLTVDHSLLEDNAVNALNYVRKTGTAQVEGRLVFGDGVRAFTNTMPRERPDCDFLYPLRHAEALKDTVNIHGKAARKRDDDASDT